MIEYTTVLAILLVSFIVSLILLLVRGRLGLLGIIMFIIDLFTFYPEPLSSGKVIVGYYLSGSVITPVIQYFTWLRLIILVVLLLSLGSTAINMLSGEGGS